MDPQLLSLHQLLRNYLEAVPRQQEENPPDLLVIYQRLDEAEQAVQSVASPLLRHYLQNKSYRKAYLLLEDLEAGKTRGCEARSGIQ